MQRQRNKQKTGNKGSIWSKCLFPDTIRPHRDPIMKLETDRLVLRPFTQSDLAYILEYGTNPDFYRYLPIEQQTEETIRTFFKERMKGQTTAHSARTTWAVALKESDRIIGTIRLEILDPNESIADIGYAMDLKFGGQGYMLEAVKRALIFGFAEYNIKSVWAVIHPDNVKSQNLVVKTGFHKAPPPSLPTLLSRSNHGDYFYTIYR